MSNLIAANLARKYTDIRKEKFSGEIDVSVEQAKRYTLTDIRRNKIDISSCGEREYKTIIDVTDTGIQYYLKVMLRHMALMDGKKAILNPANYVTPGGHYIVGGSDYEENICFTTTLYEVLSRCDDYYNWNANHLNKGLGTNVCLYTPNIVVCDNCNNNIGSVDVISCSAPNYDVVPVGKANKAVRDRIELVLDVAVRNEVKHMILCGFGSNYKNSDVGFIANTFHDLCTLYQARFDDITFVLDCGKEVRIFKEVFGCLI